MGIATDAVDVVCEILLLSQNNDEECHRLSRVAPRAVATATACQIEPISSSRTTTKGMTAGAVDVVYELLLLLSHGNKGKRCRRHRCEEPQGASGAHVSLVRQ